MVTSGTVVTGNVPAPPSARGPPPCRPSAVGCSRGPVWCLSAVSLNMPHGCSYAEWWLCGRNRNQGFEADNTPSPFEAASPPPGVVDEWITVRTSIDFCVSHYLLPKTKTGCGSLVTGAPHGTLHSTAPPGREGPGDRCHCPIAPWGLSQMTRHCDCGSRPTPASPNQPFRKKMTFFRARGGTPSPLGWVPDPPGV